jgi:hypothetical protein
LKDTTFSLTRSRCRFRTGIEGRQTKRLPETIDSIKTNSRRIAGSYYYFGRFKCFFRLNPAARVVLIQFSTRMRRSRNEFGNRQRLENSAAQSFNEHEIEVALDLIYDRRNLKRTFAHTTRSANLRRCFRENGAVNEG